MQLKKYQKKALDDLDQYINILNEVRSLPQAFSLFWESKGIQLNETEGLYENQLKPYVNSVPHTPRVTLKVPTAGGKTFIACHAIKRILDGLKSGGPNKVVAWFVPSDTILTQTLEKLKDVTHPYRQTIDSLFNHHVVVVDKEAALMGQGINPVQLMNNLTIFVLSAQSFIENIKTKQGKGAEQQKPRAFRENGNFLEHTQYFTHPEKMIDNADPTALIQVIAQERPLVIVDESHNFKADLRVELLNNLSPRFILELTATPRENSNIICYVDAMQLKLENMVKLPVIVENREKPNDVISCAIRLRNSLEQLAIQMRQADPSASYIRPIVLFQAQPKTDDDNVTFEKVKATLVKCGIPDDEIKIKTANKDELKGIDLMDENCSVKYIITVNALKEGWDCPFAYILATLANKSSRVDVEQILGRILRQPYTKKHANNLLNISYIFTSSNDFQETVNKIIISLQKSGFSRKDYREALPPSPNPPRQEDTKSQLNLFNAIMDDDKKEDDNEQENGIDLSEEDTNRIILSIDENSDDTTHLHEQALQMSKEYDEKIKQQTEEENNDPLASITSEDMYHLVKKQFKPIVDTLIIPRFYIKQDVNSLFTKEEWIPLEKTMLDKDFDLLSKDTSVDFASYKQQGVTIDIAEDGDDYVPLRRYDQKTLRFIRDQYNNKKADLQKNMLSKQIARMVKIDSIKEPDIVKYVARIIENYDEDDIKLLLDNLYQTVDAVKRKITSLLINHRKKAFENWMNFGLIQMKEGYKFPEKISMAGRKELLGVGRGLYTAEESGNTFENNMITALLENNNVVFWHRNRKNVEFCINGFINHYPDYIIYLESGRVIMVETKGDFLDGGDSKQKIGLGNKWADKAGDKYRYFMVFEDKKIEGAITVKELLNNIKYL